MNLYLAVQGMQLFRRKNVPRRTQGHTAKYGGGDDAGDTSGYGAMKQLLQLNPQPDSVFCCNDPLAMGAFRAIREARLHVPRDIAVGCGNLQNDDLLRVLLTSLDQDAAGLSESVARLALNIIKEENGTPPASVLLAVRLVVRASTQR